MKHTFTAVYRKEGKWHIGWIEEIPGVNTQGKTLGELKKNLADALVLILETNRLLSGKSGTRVRREPITVSV